MRKKENNQVLVVVLLLVGAFSLPGCAKKEQQPSQPAPQSKPAIKAAPSPVPVQQQASSAKAAQAQFDFSTKKDPFKPYAPEPLAGKPAGPGPTKTARVENAEDVLPIQSYDVSKFRIAGIIVGLKENSALVIDPKGKGYVVKQGMPIGNSNGYISRIASTYLEVTEQYREENGHSRKRTIRLTLPQKK